MWLPSCTSRSKAKFTLCHKFSNWPRISLKDSEQPDGVPLLRGPVSTTIPLLLSEDTVSQSYLFGLSTREKLNLTFRLHFGDLHQSKCCITNSTSPWSIVRISTFEIFAYARTTTFSKHIEDTVITVYLPQESPWGQSVHSMHSWTVSLGTPYCGYSSEISGTSHHTHIPPLHLDTVLDAPTCDIHSYLMMACLCIKCCGINAMSPELYPHPCPHTNLHK